MELETLSCNNCGVPIDVPTGTNFVNCGYCKSRLAIKKTASSSYTEVLDKIGEHTEKIRANTAQIATDLSSIKVHSDVGLRERKLQRDLERLDREWSSSQVAFRDKSGQLPNSSRASMILVGSGVVMAIGVLGAFSGSGNFSSLETGLMIFCLAFPGLPIGLSRLNKVNQYSQAYSGYVATRADLEGQLDKLYEAPLSSIAANGQPAPLQPQSELQYQVPKQLQSQPSLGMAAGRTPTVLPPA